MIKHGAELEYSLNRLTELADVAVLQVDPAISFLHATEKNHFRP